MTSQVGIPVAAALTDWLTAAGGLLVFGATALLALLAYKQMKTLAAQAQAAQDQVTAARDQVEIMRKASDDEAAAVREQIKAAQDQVEVMREAAADEAASVRDQIRASIEQSEAIRDAVRILIQPRVLGHATRDAVRGPDQFLDLSEGVVGFPYRLTNEGGGIALNIRHGVELDGTDYQFGDGMEVRALGPGWSIPPPDSDIGGFRPLVLAKAERDLPAQWQSLPRRYWARFDNALGERYETRNPIDPWQPATFEQVPSSRQ